MPLAPPPLKDQPAAVGHRHSRPASASIRSATRSSGTRCGSPRSGCRRSRWTGWPGPPPSDMIHIEADIHATEGNKNGCPKDEFIPYLTVHYAIVPRGRGGEIRRADPRRADADGRARRLALRGQHPDAQGRPVTSSPTRSSPPPPPDATATRPPASTPGGSRSRSRSTGIIRAPREHPAGPTSRALPDRTDRGLRRGETFRESLGRASLRANRNDQEARTWLMAQTQFGEGEELPPVSPRRRFRPGRRGRRNHRGPMRSRRSGGCSASRTTAIERRSLDGCRGGGS